MKQPTTAKHVALFLPSLRGGGAERVMVTLANGFAARGLLVDLVLAKAEGPYLGDVSATVRIVDLGAKRVAASLPGLVRYLRRERPQAMLSALNHANVIAILARMLARVPTRLVVSEHNTLSVSVQGKITGAGRLILPMMRFLYPYADGIVAVSAGVADDLAQTAHIARLRISLVYNPVVTPDIGERAAEPVKHPWLISGAKPVILGVGRLTTQKNFSLLIQAFAKVLAQRPCRLVILGEGELRRELETLVVALDLKNDVALLGFADNPFAWMRQASIFVLSSAWEGLPTVLIEAMACGTPVVSTNCPSGPAEILENGKWGKLVPVGDIEALAHAIQDTLDAQKHPDVAARAQSFGVEQAVDGYLRVLGLEE